jgi:hypothetical protein
MGLMSEISTLIKELEEDVKESDKNNPVRIEDLIK